MFILGATALVRSSLEVVHANHTDSGEPRLHNWNVHYAEPGHSDYSDEDYCVQSHDAAISSATALSRIRNTLVVDGDHWDGTNNWAIDLWKTDTPCDSLVDDTWVEFEYHVYPNNAGICGQDNLSCVYHIGPSYSSTWGHTHYMWENLYLDTQNIDGGPSEYHQVINHETGHTWSLLDPSYFGDCSADSVMHTFNYYGCPYREYPTWYDKDSVTGVGNGTR